MKWGYIRVSKTWFDLVNAYQILGWNFVQRINKMVLGLVMENSLDTKTQGFQVNLGMV